MIMIRKITSWLAVAALMAFLAAGCGGASVQQKSPSGEVRAFFAAATEAKFLSAQKCLVPGGPDLSPYSHLMEVKYPPTASVDVLSAPPSRPYEPFAVLESAKPRASGAPANLDEFKNKAREIGADAIIMCRPAEAAVSGKIEAVAIKYRVEKESRRQ